MELGWLLTHGLPPIGAFAFGAFGWFVTHWVAEPYLRFRSIRAAAHEALFFTANVFEPEHDRERFQAAYDELRRLAARLRAFETMLWRPMAAFLRWRGYRLADAASNLGSLANALHTRTGERAIPRHAVETALRLPLSDTPEYVARIQRRRDAM